MLVTERDRFRIVVTPAGRRRYVEVLLRNLQAQRDSFDRWDLWLNTIDEQDLFYLRSLPEKHPWIRCIELEVPYDHQEPNHGIRSFYKHACNDDSVYVRMDDDIVWLEPGFLDALFSFREVTRGPPLVFGNIVNNGITSHLHQRFGGITGETEMAAYHFDSPAIHDGRFAERLHRQFLKAIRDSRLQSWKFDQWILHNYDPMNVNCIAWHGDEMRMLVEGTGVHEAEEFFLAHVWPSVIGRHNVVFGRKMCVHYAFRDQRPHLDQSDVLSLYSKLV